MKNRFEANAPAGEWFDLWHMHVDWCSEGNANPDIRRECLKGLFATWRRIEALGSALARPWQSWLVIDAEDSGQDAVYLHTPNPNRDNFPYTFADVTWGVTAPDWLAEFVAEGVDVGQKKSSGSLFWVRRTKAAAEPAPTPERAGRK